MNNVDQFIEFKYLEIEKIHFDTHSTRFPARLHKMSEAEIINYLLLEAATLELMQAIGENDFFPGEQLLVLPIGNDVWKVIEGNRRLASVKLLSKPELATVKTISVKEVYQRAKYRPQNLPCLIFKKEEDIRNNFGFRHITGIKPWGLMEKSRYLYQLYAENFKTKTLDFASKELAKTIGSRKDYVKRVILSFSLFKKIEDENYYYIKDLNESTFCIGYLLDSLNYDNIAKFLGINLQEENPEKSLNETNLKLITHWFFDKNNQIVARVRGCNSDLDKLNEILNIEKSIIPFKAFIEEGKSIDTAFELTKDFDSLLMINIQKALHNLETVASMAHQVSFFYDGLDDDLIQIRKLTSRIHQSKDNQSSM